MLESSFQGQLIKELKKMFPGCIVTKNDSSYIQGIPDLTIFYKDKWATLKMNYPAIVYSLDDIDNQYANDGVYLSHRRYSVTVIDKDPDSEIVGKVSALQNCKFDRPPYQKDNLNHYVFTLR